MNFLIITHVRHTCKNGQYFGYAPYIREMNMWLQCVDHAEVIAPLVKKSSSNIEIAYSQDLLNFTDVPAFQITSLTNTLATFIKLPFIIFKLFKGMKSADHIHLRCPGNMGLLGSVIQIFFPFKSKTVKYAGNWDPNSKQPLTYKLQKWIISNTFLSRNTKVLVYGEWPNQTNNIIPFFTASFSKKEIIDLKPKKLGEKINFIFVGSLVDGKQPLLAIKIVEALKKKGHHAINLKIFGEGILKQSLLDYVKQKKLDGYVKICAGISLEELKEEYCKAHFSILPSKSEGWPKAVAEAMFFSCVPITTPVSCVPWMLNNGERGILLNHNFEKNIDEIIKVIRSPEQFSRMSKNAAEWSTKYTLEYFESEIQKIL
ncbi:glycosyltransferase family 4 protein [Zunongwangia sp.]|uniref:glycosyltransferase family 4 protein n=1 Tax=Zunongwangia sp. TaxID=1965325 RepID=UPI003AA7F127